MVSVKNVPEPAGAEKILDGPTQQLTSKEGMVEMDQDPGSERVPVRVIVDDRLKEGII